MADFRWTPEQRAAAATAAAAYNRAKAQADAKKRRCDMCGISGEEQRVLAFGLTHSARHPDGRHTTKGVGAMHLCQQCWLDTAAKRRRKRGRGRHRL